MPTPRTTQIGVAVFKHDSDSQTKQVHCTFREWHTACAASQLNWIQALSLSWVSVYSIAPQEVSKRQTDLTFEAPQLEGPKSSQTKRHWRLQHTAHMVAKTNTIDTRTVQVIRTAAFIHPHSSALGV